MVWSYLSPEIGSDPKKGSDPHQTHQIQQPAPFVSVVIPTYNRGQALIETLKQLRQQSYSAFEVLVVDQTSLHPKGVSETIGELVREGAITYLKLKEPSVTRAKNWAISQARGKIILTLDDDLEFGPELVKQHAQWYIKPEVKAVGGKVVEIQKRPRQFFPAAFGQFNYYGEPNTNSNELLAPTEIKVTPGGNFSFQKEVWQAMGGFDENFLGNAVNEDSDFCLRLTKAGYRLWFDPQIEVRHQRCAVGGTRGHGDVLNWFEQMFANNLYFFLKHFPHWRLPLFFMGHLPQEVACIFKYGRLSPRAWLTPTRGYWRGWQTYRCSR